LLVNLHGIPQSFRADFGAFRDRIRPHPSTSFYMPLLTIIPSKTIHSELRKLSYSQQQKRKFSEQHQAVRDLLIAPSVRIFYDVINALIHDTFHPLYAVCNPSNYKYLASLL
jgi:hypothetical protein